MSRGKYAVRATKRREDSEISSEIATYQNAVKRLTAQNASLRDDLAKARAAHMEDARTLRAQLAEGLSPELYAMRREIEKRSDLAAQATAKTRRIQESYDRLARRFALYLERHVGYKHGVAGEVVYYLSVAGDGSSPLFDMPEHILRRWRKEAGGDEGLVAVAAARRGLAPFGEHQRAAIELAELDTGAAAPAKWWPLGPALDEVDGGAP